MLIRTVYGGKFDWGGYLLKSNAGAQRFAQEVWKSSVECMSRSKLYCKIGGSSSRESGFK